MNSNDEFVYKSLRCGFAIYEKAKTKKKKKTRDIFISKAILLVHFLNHVCEDN